MRATVRIRLVWLAIALFLELPPHYAAQAARSKPGQSLAIVVNRANPVENLSLSELRKIFLVERSHWPNGRRIVVAMMDDGQPERQTVLRQIYRMNEDGYRDYFIKGMFREDIFVAPKTLASPIVMRKFVFNAPGAIGYLRSSEVDASVKVLRIDGHLPDDKDYSLQIDEQPVK